MHLWRFLPSHGRPWALWLWPLPSLYLRRCLRRPCRTLSYRRWWSPWTPKSGTKGFLRLHYESFSLMACGPEPAQCRKMERFCWCGHKEERRILQKILIFFFFIQTFVTCFFCLIRVHVKFVGYFLFSLSQTCLFHKTFDKIHFTCGRKCLHVLKKLWFQVEWSGSSLQ